MNWIRRIVKPRHWLVFLFPGIFFAVYPQELPEEVESILKKEAFSDHLYVTKRGKRFVFPNTYKVLFGGDVMLSWGVEESIQSYGREIAFEDWKEVFGKVHRRFFNFESTIQRPKTRPFFGKSFVFSSGIQETQFLIEYLNIDGFFLGNNHSMDYGWEGLEATIEFFKKQGIYAIGAGVNEEESYKPIRLWEHNTQISIYSVSDVQEKNFPFSSGKKPGVAHLNESILKKFIKKEPPKTNPILSVHWGLEYSWEPTQTQRKQARRLLDSGFVAIVGHHPHIPQGIEVVQNKPVVYSLGNFIFGSRNHYLNHNILVIFHFQENKLVALEVIPAFGKFKNFDHIFFPLAPQEAEEFLEEYALLCKRLGTELMIQGGRGYVFLDTKSFSKQ